MRDRNRRVTAAGISLTLLAGSFVWLRCSVFDPSSTYGTALFVRVGFPNIQGIKQLEFQVAPATPPSPENSGPWTVPTNPGNDLSNPQSLRILLSSAWAGLSILVRVDGLGANGVVASGSAPVQAVSGQEVSVLVTLTPVSPSDAGVNDGGAGDSGHAGNDAGVGFDAGCGTDGGRVPALTACTEMLAAEQQRLSECLGTDVSFWQVALPAGTICGVEMTSFDAGRQAYHPDRLDCCLANLSTAPCKPFVLKFLDEEHYFCDDVFVGEVASLNGGCSLSQDCVEGLCGTSSCPGICFPFADAGTACGTNLNLVACDPGLECISKVCQPWGEPGNPCGSPADPDCDSLNAYCADAGSGSTEQCASRSSSNACFGVGYENVECPLGFNCMRTSFSAPGSCVLPLASGQPCRAVGQCELGTYCAPNATDAGVCVPGPGAGQPCGYTGRDIVLDCVGSYCVLLSDGGATGTCTAYQQTGAPCSEVLQCGPFDYCACAPDGGCGCQSAICALP
jgi:hypothetical protein